MPSRRRNRAVAVAEEEEMTAPKSPVDEMISQTRDWRGRRLAQLRKIILDADPEMTEAVKWRRPSNPMGAPVWEHDGIVCVGNILKERVRLTFPAGAGLPDPHKIFNARLDSKTARAMDVYEQDKINTSALSAVVKSGVQHNLAKAKPSRARGK
jgi:hypothetical protein